MAKNKPKAIPIHPPTSEMVDAAIKTLKERNGSSLLAIKKYLTANYKVHADKLAPFIKKHLRLSVESGKYIQTKGKGASGSFKLSASEAKNKKEAKPKVKQPSEKNVKKSATGTKKAVDENKMKATIKVSSEKKKPEKSMATKKSAAKKSATVKNKRQKSIYIWAETKPTKAYLASINLQNYKFKLVN